MFASPLDEAKTLIMRGEFTPAVQRLSEFLNTDFFHDEALFMLGYCMQMQGMNGLSAVLLSAAIDSRTAKKGTFPEALMNLGGAYKAEHNNEVASRVWADALTKESLPRERAKIMTNIGTLYVNEGNPLKAIEWSDRALREDPTCHAAHANRGMACLELGRWREGWEGWKHLYGTGKCTHRNYGDRVSIWDGTPGKDVIVYGDQGIGDELFYACMLKDMLRICRKVTLDCHPRLTALFQRSFPEIEVHGTRKDLTDLLWLAGSDAEAAVAMADLPGFLRNTDDDWGDGAGYLKAAEYRLTYPGIKPRIGLSWTGGTKPTRTGLRSLPIDAMEPILRARPDAQWFSLQYTPNAAGDVCALEERAGIRISHFPGWVECYDYDRTASFVASLDLVITVCTTAHHLGGALGVPTWTLVPKRASWRYGVEGDGRPWYASAKLFRQERDGDWSAPIERIATALKEFRC